MKQSYSFKDPLLNDKQVLVVEDSCLNREVITKILRRNNIKPVTASNGEEAVTALQKSIRQQKPFALILLDITLPGKMDGFDVAEYIKNDHRLTQSEIIVISKSHKVSDRERFYQLGVSQFYPKPLSEADLLDGIRKALSKNQDKTCNNTSIVPPTEITSINGKNSQKILLAEDILINREIASSILIKQGHRVTLARNGVEAVDCFKKESFDIILMDIQMPEKNGFEATRDIRELERLTARYTHIIALTANAMQGDREKCIEAGMDDYISKPVRTGELVNAIERYQQKKALTKTETDDVTAGKPKVNLQRLFRDLDKSQNDMEKILSLFEGDLLRLLKEIELAAKAGRLAEASILLHSLQGQCVLVDMYFVNEIAQELEILAANNQSSKVEHILPALSREIREALSEMQVIRIVNQ
jgi:two-component system sensor histidine kinase/response regulator